MRDKAEIMLNGLVVETWMWRMLPLKAQKGVRGVLLEPCCVVTETQGPLSSSVGGRACD